MATTDHEVLLVTARMPKYLCSNTGSARGHLHMRVRATDWQEVGLGRLPPSLPSKHALNIHPFHHLSLLDHAWAAPIPWPHPACLGLCGSLANGRPGVPTYRGHPNLNLNILILNTSHARDKGDPPDADEEPVHQQPQTIHFPAVAYSEQCLSDVPTPRSSLASRDLSGCRRKSRIPIRKAVF